MAADDADPKSDSVEKGTGKSKKSMSVKNFFFSAKDGFRKSKQSEG